MKRNGFTLIELLVVMSIVSMLASIITSTLKQARYKSFFAQGLTQMVAIAKAGNMYYSETGDYAVEVGNGLPPAFVGEQLATWPTPPCLGWHYDWQNIAGPYVGVVMRNATSGSVYSLCLDCTGAVDDIRTDPNRSLQCY